MADEYNLLIVEGQNDASFIMELVNQKYNMRIIQHSFVKAKNCIYMRLIDIDTHFMIKIAGSKSELLRNAIAFARDTTSGFQPSIKKICIMQDYDTDTDINLILQSYFQSLFQRFGTDVEIIEDYIQLFGIPIHLLCVGDPNMTHICAHWSHTLEDILIRSICRDANEYSHVFNEITIDSIEKGNEIGLLTCTKSPLAVTMAFSEIPDSVSGFYRLIVSKRKESVEHVLTEIGFLEPFEIFITS